MKYAVEMGCGAIIPSFIKIGAAIQNDRGDTETHTHSMEII
jgi:hypothetical protein